MSIAKKRFSNYAQNGFNSKKENYQKLAEGQSPEVLFITCSDSRVVPNEITCAEAGEIFVIRNAGNLIPAYDSSLPSNEALTVEYAVSVLKVKEIVVCGHAKCGAMDGILNLDKLTALESVHGQLEKYSHQFDPSYLQSLRDGKGSLEDLISENVKVQMKNLMSYSFVKEAVSDNRLKIYGWVYDFVNGKLTTELSLNDVT